MKQLQWITIFSALIVVGIAGILLGGYSTNTSVAQTSTEVKSDDHIVETKKRFPIIGENGRFELDLSNLTQSDGDWVVGVRRAPEGNNSFIEAARIFWQEDKTFGHVPARIESLDLKTMSLSNGKVILGMSNQVSKSSVAILVEISAGNELTIRGSDGVTTNISGDEQTIANGIATSEAPKGMHSLFGKLSNLKSANFFEQKREDLVNIKKVKINE